MALQSRRDRFLSETGCVVTQALQSVAASAEGLLAFADSTIDVRRIALVLGTGQYLTLQREDTKALNTYFATWKQSSGQPVVWCPMTNAPLNVQLAPIPSAGLNLDVLTVQTGAALDGSGVPLGVPDDFAWVVKWGALAELLSKDGPARDVERAKYCEERWKQGLALAKMPVTAIDAYLNDQPIQLESVFDFDAFRPTWQSDTPGPPAIAGMAGANLLALAPTPDAVYTVMLDVLRNMPVPSADGDYIQVGREHWDAILSHASHLAAFKMGGPEFAATAPDMEALLNLALSQNDRLRANQFFMTELHDRATREEKFRPRLLGAK